MQCPRCRNVLEARSVEGVAVHVCPGCQGTLVEMDHLVPLLDALCAPLVHIVDLEAPLEPLLDEGVRIPCPRCRETMEAFAYLGASEVTVDRCEQDRLVWADPGELGTMSLVYARVNARTAEHYAHHEALRQAAEHAPAGVPGDVAATQVAGALLGGGHLAAGYGSIGSIFALLTLDQDD